LQKTGDIPPNRRNKQRLNTALGIPSLMREDILYDIGRKDAEEKLKKHH
jgi:hypothetical protein